MVTESWPREGFWKLSSSPSTTCQLDPQERVGTYDQESLLLYLLGNRQMPELGLWQLSQQPEHPWQRVVEGSPRHLIISFSDF